ncbi:MAG TPA: hypothetical protein DCX67_02585 [Opitutae bacterium]|nr:hypothetical protein [Opitutae bacterium]
MKPRNILHLCLLLFVFLCSCRRFEQEKIVAQAEPFAPRNLYPIERLPSYFNRVAVLPCHYSDMDSPILEYVDEIFHQELSQERIFETVRLKPAQMREIFGVERVASNLPLPENFLRRLEETTGANGVLFVDLDSYRAYRPISLGVRSKLVDLKTGEYMWAIDETFDSGHAGVIAGANAFQQKSQVRAISAKTSGSVLHSPRVFAKYVATTCFSTMPNR